MSTVIIGAGIIGTSTAYYLSQLNNLPESIHLVESSPELFASASGKAAGFIARDWFSSTLSPLGALSFDLHEQLAKDNEGHKKWSFCRSMGSSMGNTLAMEDLGRPSDDTYRAKDANVINHIGINGPAWLKSPHERLDLISDADTTAQIDPLALCQFLMSCCLSRGVQLHQPSEVTRVTRDSSGALASIHIASIRASEVEIPCYRLVLAAGAWTPDIFLTLFPDSSVKIPIHALAGHSITLRSPFWQPSPSLSTSPVYTDFISRNTKDNPCCDLVLTIDPQGYSPEFFSRLSGDIYLCGLNSSTYPLPSLPTKGIIDPKSISILKTTAKRVMGEEIEIVRESVCWRPMTARKIPIMGKVPEQKGVWIASGTGTWGVSLSLGIGKVMAEMLEGRQTSADIQELGL